MSNIAKCIARLECGDEIGNAVFLSRNCALTVKHCIKPYLEDNGKKILLYCYYDGGYLPQEAELLAYAEDGEGFALLKAHLETELEYAFVTSCPVLTFESCSAFGFNRNHNDRPAWRHLESRADEDIHLNHTICDLLFKDDSKEDSVKGLSGSPIVPDKNSNNIIGLICQQKSANGKVFEIRGISVASQEAFLRDNGIEIKNAEGSIKSPTGSDRIKFNVIGADDIKTIPTQGEFVSTHPDRFFGRETKTGQVLGMIGKAKIILVSGEGGIGKTEFCREILARAEKKGLVYKAVSLLECRTFDDMTRRIAGRYGIALGQKDTTDHIEQVILGKLNGILYLDNFEDLISDKNTSAEQQEKAVFFLRKCTNNREVTILISSRYKLDVDFAISEVELDVLDEQNAIRLFNWLWTGEDSLCTDENIREFVIKDLHSYPLSIVLAARQGHSGYSIERLREKWRRHWKEVSIKYTDNNRHHSLATALYMTYAEIKDQENERSLWELFTLFPDQVDEKVAESIVDNYDDVLKKLVNLGIVHSDGIYLSVQPTLREFIRETEEFPVDIQKISEKLLDYYINVYGEDGARVWGSQKSAYAKEHLQNALFFMDWLVEEKYVDAIGKLHTCIRAYYNEAPYEAVIPVARAVKLFGFKEDYIKADLMKYCGDLEMRTAKLEEAEGHYREAEGVYRRIHEDLGLANVLKAMGDLMQDKGKYCEAVDIYRSAIDLYKKTKGTMGLCYTTVEICYCYAKEGQIDYFQEYAGIALELINSIPYESVKRYCKSKLRSAADEIMSLHII